MGKGDGWLEWWDNRGESFSHTFTREETGNYYSITPYASDGWLQYDDEWEANGVKFQSDQGGVLIISSDVFDKYPDNTTFYYTFSPQSILDYTITVKADRWNGNSWKGDTMGSRVGFSKNNLSPWEKTIKVTRGESVTVYTEGASGYQPYPNDTDRWWYKVAGFYNASHVPYKLGDANNAGIDSYTFTVSGDMTIYVDFQYVSQ